MNKLILLLVFTVLSINLSAQLSIDGIVQDDKSLPIIFSNVILYSLSDSSMVKVESSNEEGKFSFKGIGKGKLLYRL